MATAAPTTPFVWGAGGSIKTPEQVAREREIAAALMMEGMDYSPVGHWLAGAARASQAGLGALKDWRANDAETAGREGFQTRWDSVFGGGDPVQTAAVDPVAAALVGTPQTASDAANAMGEGFLSSLIGTESGGNWAAQNDEIGSGGQAGHFGRLQFGQARLQDAKNAGIIPADMTPEQFMADPASQQAVEAWHFADIDRQAADMGLNAYIGQNVGGAAITPEAIRAMAHLGGIGGAQKFLETGGQYNPSDAYGTSLLDYATKHGGTGGAPVQVAQAGPSIQELIGLSSDPWANDSQRAILEALTNQQLQQQAQASDPLRQLQIEREQFELDALRNPVAEPQPLINTGDGRIFDPNKGEWIVAPNTGTPEAPKLFEIFDAETGLPYKATWNAETGAFDRVGGIQAPSGTQLAVDPTTGAVTFQQGVGLKPLTEQQSKDTVYATRAAGALPILDQFGNELMNPVSRAVEGDPTGLARGNLQSPEFQQAQQAGKEFLQAILRKDTGAAITPQETAEYGTVYLPVPGDLPPVLEQKRQARQRALAAIEAGMPPQAILQQEQALRSISGAASPAPAQSQAKQVTTEEEYNALPSGSVYMDPTGQIRTKR